MPLAAAVLPKCQWTVVDGQWLTFVGEEYEGASVCVAGSKGHTEGGRSAAWCTYPVEWHTMGVGVGTCVVKV